MQYKNVISGRFIARPNRFIAYVETSEGVQCVHVKNTGRCRELLIPDALVYLEKCDNPARKTQYDLIAVEKSGRLINMDSQAPNKVFGEFVEAGGFLPDTIAVHAEYRYGNSRLDYCLETSKGKHFVEVKGVTLEENGIARFPDAPTERGIKHIQELVRAVERGMEASLVFVIQMENIRYMVPNDETHPAFGEALREAAEKSVRVCAYGCSVTPDTLVIGNTVPVIL